MIPCVAGSDSSLEPLQHGSEPLQDLGSHSPSGHLAMGVIIPSVQWATSAHAFKETTRSRPR